MGDTGMHVNLRMRFTCTVIRVDRRTGEEREDEQFEVVNELVIDRGPSPWVSNLELYADAHSRSTAYCSFDGKSRTELRQGDYVTVQASQYPFPTVVSGSGEWFDSVRRALRWNTRGAVQRGWGASHNEELMADAGDINLGPNLNHEDLDEDSDEPWDIDTDSNSDVMHYEALYSSSRRSQLLSRSATTTNSNSTSASNTLPVGTMYNEGNNSNSINTAPLAPTVLNESSSSQPHETMLSQKNADELLKLETLNLAENINSGSSPSPA
ncbi:NAD(+) kinase [Ascosphaera aggregata]|nr:NAD(+) kinase [Ascosphaera aggregata]